MYPYWERATSSSVLTVNNGRKSRQNDRRAMSYGILPAGRRTNRNSLIVIGL